MIRPALKLPAMKLPALKLWGNMDTGPLTVSAPHPEAGALRVPGEGTMWGGKATSVFASPHHRSQMGAHRSENLAAWGGPASCGWRAVGSRPLCCFQLLLPAFPPPGTQARLTRARGVEPPGLRMTQGPAVTMATLLPSNGGLPVTSPSNGIFSRALAGAWQLFLAQLQINLQLRFWLLEKMQGVCGVGRGVDFSSREETCHVPQGTGS